jgi:hypothetical protein
MRWKSLAAALSVAGAALAEPAPPGGSALSTEELNKQLNNPVSSIWSLTLQNNVIQLKNDSGTDLPNWENGDSEWFYNGNFQPVLPLRLTEQWNLISRPVIPLFLDRPVLDNGRFDGKDGIGDITFFSLLAPAKPLGHLLWGVGPTLIFPSATPEAVGQEKWQAGPAAVALYMSHKWVIGVLPQHWWSFAGDGGAPSTSFTNVQYFVQRLFPGGWQVGCAPNFTVDWKADHDDAVTFPVGLGVGKLLHIGKLPVKVVGELDYAVVRPEDIGQRWLLRLVVTPVLPELVKRPLFGGGS